jgi:hypothetical protein
MGKPRRARICSSRAHSHEPNQLHRLQWDTAAARGVSEFRVNKPDASVPHRRTWAKRQTRAAAGGNVGRGLIRNRSPGHSLTRFPAHAPDVFVQRGPASPDAATRSRRSRIGLYASSSGLAIVVVVKETTFLLAVQRSVGGVVDEDEDEDDLCGRARARPGRPRPNQQRTSAQFESLFSYSTSPRGNRPRFTLWFTLFANDCRTIVNMVQFRFTNGTQIAPNIISSKCEPKSIDPNSGTQQVDTSIDMDLPRVTD